MLDLPRLAADLNTHENRLNPKRQEQFRLEPWRYASAIVAHAGVLASWQCAGGHPGPYLASMVVCVAQTVHAAGQVCPSWECVARGKAAKSASPKWQSVLRLTSSATFLAECIAMRTAGPMRGSPITGDAALLLLRCGEAAAALEIDIEQEVRSLTELWGIVPHDTGTRTPEDRLTALLNEFRRDAASGDGAR